MRLGDPEQLAKIMDTDPYFVTQDNGAGAPIHFATTYKQLDMVRRRRRCSPVVTMGRGCPFPFPDGVALRSASFRAFSLRPNHPLFTTFRRCITC